MKGDGAAQALPGQAAAPLSGMPGLRVMYSKTRAPALRPRTTWGGV